MPSSHGECVHIQGYEGHVTEYEEIGRELLPNLNVCNFDMLLKVQRMAM